MKSRTGAILIGVFVFASGVVAQGDGADRLREITGQFEELKRDLYSAEEKFDARYSGELEKLREKAVAAGDLEMTLAVTEEAKVFSGRTGPVEISEHEELARLQKIYADQAARLLDERISKLKGLVGGYGKQLEELRAELTRAEKIDEALAVQAEVKRAEEMAAELALGKVPDWKPAAVEPPENPKEISPGIVPDSPAELIGHWTFDKDGTDSSGKGRDAELVGAGIVEGRLGNALKTGKGMYAEIAHHDDLNLQHPFTLAAWVKRDAGVVQPKWMAVFSKTDNSWRLLLGDNDPGRSHFHVNTTAGRLEANGEPGELEEGKWHHLAAVFTGRAVIIYVDGLEKGRQDHGGDVFVQTQELAVRIGGSAKYPDRYLIGTIDDVRIYKGVLALEALGRLAAGKEPESK